MMRRLLVWLGFVDESPSKRLIRAVEDADMPGAMRAGYIFGLEREQDRAARVLAETMLGHHRQGFIYPPFIQERIDAYAKACGDLRTARETPAPVGDPVNKKGTP